MESIKQYVWIAIQSLAVLLGSVMITLWLMRGAMGFGASVTSEVLALWNWNVPEYDEDVKVKQAKNH
jgi:hypothetical protein